MLRPTRRERGPAAGLGSRSRGPRRADSLRLASPAQRPWRANSDPRYHQIVQCRRLRKCCARRGEKGVRQQGRSAFPQPRRHGSTDPSPPRIARRPCPRSYNKSANFSMSCLVLYTPQAGRTLRAGGSNVGRAGPPSPPQYMPRRALASPRVGVFDVSFWCCVVLWLWAAFFL
jgi:hypothetical protein